ncbi:MAG TPA: hypothetical protein DEF42_07790 [Desulfosporosinus sp.]|nr:hypothetical protein [Desulfosporosinus sp.]
MACSYYCNGHNYGAEYIGYPWLGILAMIHSTVNAGAALPIYLAGSGYNPILGPSMAGLVGGIP